METSRPLGITLFVYECVRLVFLTGVFILLQPEGEIPFPWLALITPGALFFLMALFWLLDARYLLFCPLYIAGKGFSVITFLLWLFLAENYTIREMIYSYAAWYIAPGTVFFLLIGDIISVWTVILIMKGKKTSDNLVGDES
jgi:hypothetical protein